MNLNHHLSIRSDFSIGESILQIDNIIAKAKTNGYESVTLMDTMSIHAMPDFSTKAKKVGIKPIVGTRIRVVADPTYRKPSKSSGIAEIPNPMYALKVYALNDDGVKSIMKLLTKGLTPEYFYYVSRVGLAEVLELEGVAVSTGDLYSVFHMENHDEILEKLVTKFGKDKTFVELCPIDTPLFDTLNAAAITAAKKLDLQTLVTYPSFYGEADDADTLEVHGSITSNTPMDSPFRPIQFVKDFDIAEPTKLAARVKGAAARVAKWNGINEPAIWVNGLANVEKLAGMCGYEFKKLPVSLPTMAANEFEALGKKCIAGWHKRFGTEVLGYKPDPSLMPQYQERLKYELAVLKAMGFAGYFLLTEDLVMWAKNNGIVVGPGRGSVGGSLVAYLIGITDVDPIRFNLLFERFINPERLDLPDADLDFQSSRRHEVVEYLRTKYGTDRVAGISNYSTLASASALRDSGRMFGLSNLELSCTKLVPKEHGISFSLEEAAGAVPEIDAFKSAQPKIWKHATKLEGAMRSLGQHAAGIVVAGEPIVNRAVIETRGESPVVNWDKRVVEDFGLVKMDLLGLSTLDVLEIAKNYIKDRHGVTIDYTRLPLEEPDVMDAFGRGDTTGVFQFESGGMKKLLRDLASGGRLCFEDIAAATALYRPGPMDSGLMDDFIQIKKGNRSISYDHPNMEPALSSTYGVIVYQEQVMRVAQDLAGFTLAEADHLRKAMGKKDKDKMAKMRDQWVKGCEKTSGVGSYLAGELFDKIEAFAGYGFNKSHAVEYSIISVWTMWLRVRYPAEYFAACMSIVAEDKLPGLVKDAREYGIEVFPPDINLSSEKFTIPSDKVLLAPFSSVKGISENTAKRIVELREAACEVVTATTPKGKTVQMAGAHKGRFDTEEEFKFAASQPGSKVNVRVVEALGKVGALASITPGALPARHIDRRRDQIALMPGLIVDSVKADRTTDVKDPFIRTKIIELVQEYRKCEDCDLGGQPHPAIRLKSTVKFMVVADCPNWQEEKKDKLLEGEIGDYVKAAIKAAGLEVGDGYFTTLVKAKKNDKFLSNGQINGCKKYLERELEVVKPPIIVTLGSAATKHFMPGLKGGTAELVGTATFMPHLDANVVVGMNPAALAFDPTKVDQLLATFAKVAEILS